MLSLSPAIIVLIILDMMLGAFWYSPKLFGNVWSKEYNFHLGGENKALPLYYVAAMIVNTITVTCLALLVQIFSVNNYTAGLQFAFLVWLGLIATTHFSGVIWAKKPLKIYLIDISYLFLVVVGDTILLVFWSKLLAFF